jgi:hypothetical protein
MIGVGTDCTLQGVSLAPILDGADQVSHAQGRLFPAHIAFSEGLNRGSERKGVTAYPWKMIYDMSTGQRRLYNLGQDPGETRNVIDLHVETRSLLDGVLMQNIMLMSETWYVEMAPGNQGDLLDVLISIEETLSTGHIRICKLLHNDGRISDLDAESVERSRISLKDIRLTDTTTLAFQFEAPPGVAVTYDLRINGLPAEAHTFIGESLVRPKQMPFSLRRRRGRVRSPRGPARRPDTPYFAVWHSAEQYGPQIAASLDAETRRELRALGYIQ